VKTLVWCAWVVLAAFAINTAGALQAAEEKKVIRIAAGSEKKIKDSEGNEWEAAKGFADGDIVDRGNIKIENTKIPEVYRNERWGMSSFSIPVPNGKYTVKLHFAETYDDLTEAGQRVFDVKVMDKELKNLDVFKESGGQKKALVKTFNVEVKDGKLTIKFDKQDEKNNPEINGIEIIAE
jgi:hypothetical protein